MINIKVTLGMVLFFLLTIYAIPIEKAIADDCDKLLGEWRSGGFDYETIIFLGDGKLEYYGGTGGADYLYKGTYTCKGGLIVIMRNKIINNGLDRVIIPDIDPGVLLKRVKNNKIIIELEALSIRFHRVEGSSTQVQLKKSLKSSMKEQEINEGNVYKTIKTDKQVEAIIKKEKQSVSLQEKPHKTEYHFVVSRNHCNLLSGPSISNSVVFELKRNTKLIYLGKRELNYFYVQTTNGKKGWVNEIFLKRLK